MENVSAAQATATGTASRGETVPPGMPAPPPLSEQPSPLPGISHNVFVLSVVSFFNDVAGEMLYPVVPIFLATALGAPYAAIGLVEGAAEAAASGLKGFSGWAVDRFGHQKALIGGGYLLSAAAKPLLGLAMGWPLVLAARVLDRVGKGIRTAPRDALIADSASAAARGRAFGFHRAADTAGAVVGPLLAIALIDWLGENNLRPIFLLALLPGLAAVALVPRVRESARPPRLTQHSAAAAAPTVWTAPLLGFLGVSTIFAVVNSSDAFLILRAKGLGLSTTVVILAYVVYNLVFAGLSTAAGSWSDRVGRKPALVLGLLIFAGVYAGLAVADSSLWVWPLFAVYGAYIALSEGVGKALLTDLAPVTSRGTVMGVYQLVVGLGTLVASVIAGWLWDAMGAPAPFWYGAAGALLAALLLLAIPFRTTGETY
jgi:MFS family permease